MTEQELRQLELDLARMDDDGYGSVILTGQDFTPVGPWAIADTEEAVMADERAADFEYAY